MSSTLITIYCDESGASGNNLLDENSQLFTFASVAISEVDASRIVQEAFTKFGLQGRELKSSNLLRTTYGQEVISFVIREVGNKVHLSYSNKPLALAGNFFQYVFEPTISQVSSFFYGVEFHLFIMNFLYVSSVAGVEGVKELLAAFQHFMRDGDITSLSLLLSNQNNQTLPEPIRLIVEFANLHLKEVEEEYISLREVESISKWVLDLSTTTLFTHLDFWMRQPNELQVYCDDSKPIAANAEHLDAMLATHISTGRTIPSGSVVRPIQMVKSKNFPGIQLADILCGTLAWCLLNPEEPRSKVWLESLQLYLGNYNILPNLEKIDMNFLKVMLNNALLIELVERSRNGVNLTLGIQSWYFEMAQNFLYE